MKTKKTILQWFETLPEPAKSKAISNTMKSILNSHEPSLESSISRAFPWCITPEGHEYWDYVLDCVKKNKFKYL